MQPRPEDFGEPLDELDSDSSLFMEKGGEGRGMQPSSNARSILQGSGHVKTGCMIASGKKKGDVRDNARAATWPVCGCSADDKLTTHRSSPAPANRSLFTSRPCTPQDPEPIRSRAARARRDRCTFTMSTRGELLCLPRDVYTCIPGSARHTALRYGLDGRPLLAHLGYRIVTVVLKV
ncbi:hypothetical protein RRG08_043943 [Elysia crispata]|uniref:Uncharacterized protein n=1 Tax=Elysia crispata TaxID=231223 RepID=A0AAE1CQI8_9GAST|nr:hypothetical protein RRG08_043943 [Elysia crispata]